MESTGRCPPLPETSLTQRRPRICDLHRFPGIYREKVKGVENRGGGDEGRGKLIKTHSSDRNNTFLDPRVTPFSVWKTRRRLRYVYFPGRSFAKVDVPEDRSGIGSLMGVK